MIKYLRARKQSCGLAMTMLLLLWQIGHPLQAATLYWDGSASGSWSTVANWSTIVGGGSDPAAVPGAVDDVIFNATTITNQIATLDGPQSVRSLTYSSNATTSITLAAGTSGSLALGSGGITIQSGSAAHTISAPISLTAAQTWTNDSASLLTISGAITGYSATNTLTLGGSGNMTISGLTASVSTTITKNGTGTVTIGGADPNFTGTVVVNAGVLDFTTNTNDFTVATVNNGGTLRARSGSNVLSDSLVMTINTGGIYDIQASDTIAAILGTGTVSAGAAATLTVNNATNRQFDGVLANGAAALTFSKSGTNTVTLTNNSTYTGTTTINTGRLAISGANGRLSGSTTINVGDNNGAGDALQLGATGGADTMSGTLDRIADGATITLSGGVLDFQGPNAASVGTTEIISALAIGATGTNVITLTAATGGTVQLSATSMTRTANTGTALVRGTALGSTGTDTARLALTTAPTGNNFIGTSTTGGDKNLRIVPWLVGDSTATGAGSGFVTFDATNGFRTLAAGEYGTVIAGNATNNIANAGGETFSVASSNFSVNSMLMTAGTTTVNGGAVNPLNYLTVGSGAVLFTANATLSGTGRLNFGAVEGIIHAAANTTAIAGAINNVITGTAGLTFGSTGDVGNTVALGGANLFTGGVVINSGVLRLDHGNALGGVRALNAVTLNTAGTLSVNGQNAVIGNLTGVAGSVVNNANTTTAGRLRIHQTTDQNFTGTIVNGTGAAALNVVKTGANALTLNAGNSTFTGALAIQQGTIVASGNAGRVSGATSISIGGGGVLRLTNTTGTSAQANRLIDGTTVTMRGGTFDYDNNAGGSTAYSETVGQLNFLAGANTVTVDQAVSGQTTVLTSASLARTQGAVVTFTSQTNNSTNNTLLGLNAQDRLVLTAAPTLNDGIIGGWAFGGPNGAQFATYWGGTPSVGYLGQATTLTTPAGSQLYSDNLAVGSWTTSTNVRLLTTNATVPAISANTTVNSLTIATNPTTANANNITINSGFTLTVDSGGLIYYGSTGTAAQISGTGNITARGDVVAPDLIVHIPQSTDSLTIAANIVNGASGATGFTKSGAGPVTLTGTNTYTGPTAVVGGTLNIDSDTRLGTAPGSASAGHLKLYNGSTLNTTAGFTLNANRLMEIGGGGTVSITATGNLVYNGTITSPIPTGATAPDVTNLTLTGDIDMALAGNTTIGGTLVQTGGAGTQSLITLGGTNNVIMGSLVIARGGNRQARMVYTGAGSLSVGSLDPGASNLDIGNANAAGTGNVIGELDLSSLSGTFTANIANLRVGFDNVGAGAGYFYQGTLKLGASSNITATTAVLLGDSPNDGGGALASTITYGAGSHILTTPLVTIGGRKVVATGSGLFLQAGAILSIGGFGPAASELRIAYNNVGTGAVGVGTLDATLGVLKGDFSTITVGFKNSTLSGGADGSLLVGTDSANHILATNIIIGDQRSSDTTTTANIVQGTFTFGGGTLGVSQNLTIGNHQGANTQARVGQGAVNLNGGTTTVSGNVIVANTAPSSGTGLHSTTGTLNVAGGDLTITGNLVIGNTVSNIAVVHASTGTVNISSASSDVTVSGDVQLGSVNSVVINPIATGTLVLSNGALTVAGNITRALLNGADASQSRGFINVAGGALDMTNGTILAKSLAFRAGSISNVAAGGVTLDANSSTSTTTITGDTGDALILRDVTAAFNVALTGTSSSTIHYESAGAGAGGTLSGNLDLGTVARSFNIEDIVANAHDLTVSGIISNSGNITKTGAGTLRLLGANTFTGTVSIIAGEIAAGNNQGFSNANNAYDVGAGAFLSAGGFSNTIGALTGSGTVRNNTATNGTLTVGGGNATSTFSGAVQDGAGGGVLNLVKTGTGIISLTGAANLTYSGSTTVNGGVLNAGLRGTQSIIQTGGALNFTDSTANTLTLGSSGNVLQLSGGTLGFELGATGDKIVLAGTAKALTSGTTTLDIYGIAGLAAGTYRLIDAPNGGLLSTNGSTGLFNLGSTPSGFALTPDFTDTYLDLTLVAFVGKYWRGEIGGSWITNNSGDTNWTTDAAGLTEAGVLPGSGDSVLFSASNATGPAITTTLDGDFTVKELLFLSQPAGVTSVTIDGAPGDSLTISPTTAATQGISVAAGAGNVTISAPLTIGADQRWEVINALGTSLTVSGDLSGSAQINKTGSGTATISGADNTNYSGGITLTAGQLNLNNATALGTGGFTIAGGILDNTTAGAISLTTSNTQAWNGNFAFAGTQNLTFGSGAITLGGNRTITTSGTGQLIQTGDVAGAFSLTKAGAGTLVLAGNNSNYSAGTIINSGTLAAVVTGAGGSPLGSGNVTLNAGTLALRGDGTGSGGAIALGNNLIVAGSATVDVDRFSANTGNTFTLGTLSIGASTLTVNSTNNYGLSFTTGSLTGNATVTHAGVVTIGGALGGAFSLTKSGTGTLVLNGASTFSGGVIQTAGTINLGNKEGLGSGTYNVTGASTLTPTVDLSAGGSGPVTNAFTLDAGLTLSGTESLTLSGILTNSSGSQTLTNNLDVADTLTLAGIVNLSETNTARTLIISGTGNTVQSGTSVIQNGGTAASILDKSGTGTLTLNGANTFSDDLILRQGTLILGHKNAAGTDRLQTASNSNSVIQANTDLTGANALPVQFLLNVGTTIVSGTNSFQFTGTTTNNGGSRTLTNSMTGTATLTLGTVNLSNDNTGRTMTFTGAGTTIVGVIANGGTGAGNLTKSGAGALIVTGTATFTGATTVNDGVLQIGNAGTTGSLNTTSGINLVASTSILRFNRSNALTSHTVAISGAGSVEQVGAGITTITSSNTYTGTTTISGGGLTIGNNGATGNLGAGDVIMSNNSTLTFNRTDAQTIANNITGTGNLTKTSTGAVTLTPGTANTFAGTITVLNNSLIAGNANALGGPGNNLVITATGAGITATLNLNGTDYTAGSVTLGGTTATSAPVITTGVGVLTLGGDLTYSATGNPLGALISGNLNLGTATRSFNIGNSTSAATDLDLQALISGIGVGITKSGDGTLSLGGTASNTFTGITTVNGGTLVLAKGPGLAVIGGDLVIGDGTGSDLVRLTNNDQIAGTSLVSFNGTGANAGILQLNAQSQTLGGLSSTGGAGIVENGAAGQSILTLNVASGTRNFAGIIQNGSAGTLALVKSGAGTQILSGANSFTDGISINAGTLEVGSADALGTSGTISFGGGALRFSSSNTTDYSGRFSTAAAQPVKIDTNGQNVVFATALSSSGGTLEKSGLGSLVLSAANTYAGATAVNAGKLFVNGSLDAASAVTVAGGATLGGSGSIPGAVTVNNGGIIEAGHLGTGTLTIGTLNLGAAATDTSIINLSNIATGTPGILDLTTLNVVTNTGTITINISNAAAVATGTYKLIDYTGSALTDSQRLAFVIGTTTGFNSRQILSLSNNTTLTQIELTMTGDAPKWTGFDTATGLNSSVWHPSNATLLNWKAISDSTPTDYRSGDQVLFDDTATGSYTVSISSGDVDPASVEFNNSNGVGKTYTLTGINGITGTTGLTKNNTGTLIINNPNSFTGGVFINDGIIQLGNPGALGTGNLLTFGADAPVGTKLQLNGNNATVTGLVSAGSNAVVENGTGASTNATLTVNLASGSNTFAGVLQDGGTDTLGLSQTGAGTLILTGTNNYTGGTSVGAGSTLQVGAGGAGGSIAGNATVNGTLRFNRTGTVVYGGTVGGTGSLSIVAGTLEFTGTVNNTLAGTSISSGATLQIGNGTLGGTVSSNIANAGTLVVNLPAAGNTILSGNITGAGALTTAGNGTTILTGANSYNGATTIGTGTTLQVGNGGTTGALGTGTVTVDGTLRFSRSDALIVSAPLAGAGGVNIAVGNVTFTGDNTYTSTTTIDSGATLTIGLGGVLGIVVGDIQVNGSVVFNRGDAITYSGLISGTGTVTKSGNGITTFTGSNTYSGSTTINGGTLSISASNNLGNAATTNTLAISNGAILQSTGASVDLGANRTVTIGTGGGVIDVTGANVLTLSGLVSGTSLTKTGTGVLTLSAANTHSGGTTLSAGTLNITQAAAIGSGLFTIAGGTIDVTGGSAVTLANNAQAWNGDFTFTGTNDLNLGSGAVNLSADRIVTVSAGTLTVAGVIGDTGGDFGLTKSGAGTLVLTGTNTFGSGDAVTLTAGTLVVNSSAALGANTNDVFFTGASTLKFTANASFGTGQYFRIDNTAATIEVDNGVLVDITGGGTGSATNGINTNGGTDGVGASLIKTGLGTLRIAGNNGFFDGDGGWVVTQGTLSIAGTSTAVLGDATPATVALRLNGGTVSYDTDTANIVNSAIGTVLQANSTVVSNVATAGSGLTQRLNVLTVNSGGLTLNVQGGSNVTSGVAGITAGATTLNGNATFNISDPTGGGTTLLTLGAVTGGTNSITLTGNGDFAQTGAFASTAATSLTLNSSYSGLATLSQTNTYTGATTINGGTLAFSTSANLGDATQATNSISINGGTLSYTGAGSLDIGANRVITVGSSGATLNATGAAGILTVSGGISSTGNLTKTGIGSIIVSGTTSLNLGTGSVTVSGGLLAAGFGAGGVDNITVAAGAALYNTDSSATTLLLPTTGSLTLTAGSSLATASKLGFGMNLSSAAAISLDATTPLTINSTSPGDTIYIDLVSLGTALTEQDYNLIIDSAGRLLTGTGGAVTYALDNVIGGYVYTLDAQANLVKVNVSSFNGFLYWRGDVDNSWTTYNAANTNWTNALTGGADSGVTPGSQTTVVFSATEATGPSISTTLDGNVTIKNLQFTSNPSGVTAVSIGSGTFGSLTIGNALGIDVAANAGAITISAPVVLGASQTWAVDGTGGASLTISGGVGGTAGLTILGTNSGIVTLSGTNLATYNGATIVGSATAGSGLLQAGAATSFSAASAHTINAGGTLRLNGLNNTIGSLAGAGTVDNNTATNATLTTGGDNTSTTFSGTLVNGSTGTLGLTKVGTGTLTLSGASNALTGNVIVNGGILATTSTFGNGVGTTSVGSAASTRGVLYLGSGASYSTTTLASGGNATGLGALVIRGGTFATTTATTTAGVASGNGGYGGIFMSSGSFSTRRFDTGTSVVSTAISVNQMSGGTWANSEFILLRNARSEFTITGGTVNHSGASAVIAIGELGTAATLNVAGGTLDNTGQTVQFGRVANSISFGSLNLNAGTLITNGVTGTAANITGGAARVNFNGGTLRASVASATFLNTGLTGAYVNGAFGTFTGGAVVDTNSFDITFAEELLAPTGNGVSGLTVGNAGSGYIGAPYVEITGGGGTGATGYATVDLDPASATYGQITGVVLTNPGIGYTSTPTVTLLGGGGTGGSVSASGIVANTSGGLTKNGTGRLTLSGANTYDGVTTISAGELALSGATATLGSTTGNTVVRSGAALRLQTSMTLNEALTLSGSGVGAAGNTFGALLTNVNTGTWTFAGAITLDGGAAINTFQAGLATMIISQGIGGTGALTLSGSAANNGTTLYRLQGASSYTGDTILSTINSQGLTVQSEIDNALPTSTVLRLQATSGTTTFGKFRLNGFNQTVAGLAGSVAANTLNSIVGGSTTLSTLTVNNTTDYVFDGQLGNTGTDENNLALVKSGAGKLTLTGANTYTGATTISAGTLQVGNGTDAGSIGATSSISNSGALVYNVGSGTRTLGAVISGNGTLTQNSAGGTLTLTGANTYTGATTISAGTLQVGNGTDAGAIETTSSISNSGALVYNVGSGARTLGVVISGSGTLTQNSVGGTLTLTGDNTYTGATTINAGTVIVSSNTGLGSTAGNTTVNSGATLQLNGVSVAENIVLNYVSDFAHLKATGNSTISGTVALTGQNKFQTVSASDVLTISGVISGGSIFDSLRAEGPGKIILIGSNTYRGNTMILGGGSVQLGDGGDTGSISSTSTVFYGQLIVNRSNDVVEGTDFGGFDSYSASLVQAGSGTTTLNANNLIYGGTSVINGELRVTGRINSDSSTVIVGEAGGTLSNAAILAGSGNGTTTGIITGAVTIGGAGTVGILAPGATSANADKGTLTLTAANTALTVANGSQIQLAIGSPTNDSIPAITFVNGQYEYKGGTYANALALFTSTANNDSLNGADGAEALATWNVAPTATTNHDFLSLTGTNSNLTVGNRASASYGDGSIRVMSAGLTGVAVGQVFNLIDWQQASAMSFSYTSGFIGGANPIAGNLDLPDLDAITGTSGAFVWDTTAFGQYGILVVVPEPSRALFLLLGLLGLMLRRRRR